MVAKWRDALDHPGLHLKALAASEDVDRRLRAIFALVSHPDLTEGHRRFVREECRKLAAILRESGPVNLGDVVYKAGPDGGLQCCLPWM